jgi:hypothetical protein
MDGPGQPALAQPARFSELTLTTSLFTLVEDLQGLQECCLRLQQLLPPLLLLLLLFMKLPVQLHRHAALASRACERPHVVLHGTVAWWKA